MSTPSTAIRSPAQRTPVLAVHRREIPDLFELAPRSQQHHKLMWAPTGPLTIQAGDHDWVVPPTHALWIPAGVAHGSRALRAGAVYRVRIDAQHSPVSWPEPTSVVVGRLMRELIVHLAGEEGPKTRPGAETLLLDLLTQARIEAIFIPLPRDPRARAVAEALIDDPADDRDLGAWGVEVGASIRTLARLFRHDTGMTFREWRAQVRMRAALGLLAEGLAPSKVARRVGYRTPSSFVAAFHRLTGDTPGATATQLADTALRAGGLASEGTQREHALSSHLSSSVPRHK